MNVSPSSTITAGPIGDAVDHRRPALLEPNVHLKRGRHLVPVRMRTVSFRRSATVLEYVKRTTDDFYK